MERVWIKSARFYHFQCYIDEVIEFCSTTNAIIGETDKGKSTISRGIYWCLYNRPVKIGRKDRDEFTTWGQNHCFVQITLSNGNVITRGRKNKENYYTIQNPEGEIKTLKGFGFEVPPEVLEAHGMIPLDFDGKDQMSMNIGLQLDPIFMLAEGPAKRAKIIRKINGADKADGAIGLVQSWKR